MASLDPSQELPDSGTPYPYTCSKCPGQGDIDSDLFYEERYRRHVYNYQDDKPAVVHDERYGVNADLEYLPSRCRRCNRQYCKYKNTKKQIYKLTEYSFQRRGEYAKMITVALPCRWNGVRDKFHLHEELMQRWRKLYQFLTSQNLITGGIYVREMTQKVVFNGHTMDFCREEKKFVPREVGSVDPYGVHKYHAHIHAVVDMPTYRGEALKQFSEIGYRFGLGRISVTPHDFNAEHWEIKHLQAKYLAKYTSKDLDCGRQATFGKFIGFKLPRPGDAKNSTSSQNTIF